MTRKNCFSTFAIALAALTVVSASAFATAPETACSDNAPASARFMLASLSMIRAGFQPILGPETGNMDADEVSRELCAEETGMAIEASKTKSGYTDVTLNFTHENCTETLLLSTDGRVASTAGDIVCKSN
jgi:hypothetical protein